MKPIRVLLSLIIVVAVLFAPTLSVGAIGFEAETAYESVFVIYSGKKLGSGFAVGENCIVTNAHVIDNPRNITVETYGGTKYKAAAMINGQSTAQLMFVTGTDGGGLRHDDWLDNLSLQLQLHDTLNTRYPGLMRPVSIRNARFNQHIRTGSMLLEVGTSGNSLTEAIRAVRLFGTVLADLLLEA